MTHVMSIILKEGFLNNSFKKGHLESRHRHLDISIGIDVGIGIAKNFFSCKVLFRYPCTPSWEFQLLFRAVIL